MFIDDSAMFTWRGEEDLGGRTAVRYDFRVPAFLSGWEVRVEQGRGVAGMKGSVWADPDSLDLLRLEINGDDIPPQLEVNSVSVSVDYGRTHIGARDIMLPQTGEMRMAHRSGIETRNLLEFTHCRAFETESTLTFVDSGAALPVAASARPPQPEELPPGLTVTLKLATPVTEKSAIGETVEALVAGNVAARGRVWIPDGARVTGRIRRLYRYSEAVVFYTVGLEFTEVHAGGSTFRFFADLKDPDWRKAAVLHPGTKLADLPGVGTFFVDGSQFTLPPGFQTVWKTRSAVN
jgi:hypothetical protein